MSTTSWIIFFVCLFVFALILYKWKNIKAYFSKLFKSSNKGEKKKKSSKKDGENGKGNTSKLKSSEKQTRPILKPPEESKAENKKEENKVNNGNVIDVKPIEYKLSSTPAKKQDTKELLNLKNDLDKEFEDIRKYLNMPEPINLKTSGVKKVPGNQVASPFDNNDNFKANVGNFNPYSANSFVKGVGRAGSTASEGKFPYNSRSASRENISKNTYNSANIPSNKSLPVSNFKPTVDIKNINQDLPYSNAKLNKTSVENKVVIDGEELDLNKLPLNIKRLIVSNILARKNYDD